MNLSPVIAPSGSRGRILRRTVALIASLGLAAGGLAACAAPSSTPVAKDSVSIGINGGSTGTVLDPHVLTDPLSTWFAWAFYEPIGTFNANDEYESVLAESFTPNADATQWTLVLKDGITFHSGKPLTADDVIFTFNRILDPATAATAASTVSVIQNMAKIDDKTVQFTLSAPRGEFDKILSDGSTMGIVPTDFDITKPDSTGPWVFDSYQPGVQVNLTKFAGYHGTPATLASVSLVALPDTDARTNALVSGQIDVDPFVIPANLPQIENNPNFTILDLPTGQFQVVTMRVDRGPTADPRVREALRLAVDRDQIMTVVDGGHARRGNDLYGIDDPNFRADLVRTRDVEQAKQLVTESGVGSTPITLYTIAGIEPMAQIVAQNAREIGLNVTVQLRDDASFYSDGYLEYDVATDQWPASSILNVASLTDAPGASLAYTKFNDPEFNAAYETAITTTDPATRKAATGTMQEILFDRGGFIIPRFANRLVATPTTLTGWPAADPSGGILLMKSLNQLSWS